MTRDPGNRRYNRDRDDMNSQRDGEVKHQDQSPWHLGWKMRKEDLRIEGARKLALHLAILRVFTFMIHKVPLLELAIGMQKPKQTKQNKNPRGFTNSRKTKLHKIGNIITAYSVANLWSVSI